MYKAAVSGYCYYARRIYKIQVFQLFKSFIEAQERSELPWIGHVYYYNEPSDNRRTPP